MSVGVVGGAMEAMAAAVRRMGAPFALPLGFAMLVGAGEPLREAGALRRTALLVAVMTRLPLLLLSTAMAVLPTRTELIRGSAWAVEEATLAVRL